MEIARGSDSVQLSNRHVAIAASTLFGPRITSLSQLGGRNILAELGEMGIELPDGRTYLLRGGHRLWAAPEIPEITYEPDNQPVDVVETATGLSLHQDATDAVGIEKSVAVSLDGNSVELNHTLTNRGNAPLRVAPWAITQLAVGGVAVVPLRKDAVDIHGLQPNATIAVWPYTGVEDNPFRIHNRLVLLDATRPTPTKLGVPLDRGWLAYVLDGLVFVKRAHHVTSGNYLDLNASGQCYCNSEFVELETLGQLSILKPGQSASHVESWELHRIDPATPPYEIPQLLDLDGGTNQ